ncbi:MAG: lipocalin family protein [Cyclobacteriaceae bacterium]
MRTLSLLLLLLLSFEFSCSNPEESPYELPSKAKQLLTGDSSKTWKLAQRYNNKTRMNMGDCFLSHRETYSNDMTMYNNSGDNRDCGETLQANWKFVKDKKGNYYVRIESEQLPELMNIDKDYKLFKVLRLTDDQMTLQFKHKQFSNKTTTITDIYVPEHIEVKDREFHW